MEVVTMKKFFAALTFAGLLLLAAAQQPAMATLTFVTGGSVLAGNPLSVTVYDSAENFIPVASVVWTLANGSPLPATLTVAPTPSGGFGFVSTVTGTFSVKATVGAASGTFLLNFTGLKFTSP